MKMYKKDFNPGSPYSCWLREEMIGEVYNPSMGFKNRGLVKKHKVYVDDETRNIIMNAHNLLENLPDGLKKIAVDIIRIELDKNFKI